MQLAKLKLKGSSLMEVLVGLVLLSLSIALTGTFFAQVFDASNNIAKQKAWYDANLLKNNTLNTKNIEMEEILKSSYKLIKTAQLVNESKGLWMVNINALKQNKNNGIWNDELVKIQFYVEIEHDNNALEFK